MTFFQKYFLVCKQVGHYIEITKLTASWNESLFHPLQLLMASWTCKAARNMKDSQVNGQQIVVLAVTCTLFKIFTVKHTQVELYV